ncbi:MAG: hypothetical protein EXS25_02200 [Pedosphaera sp.]|nr:hypothetical protein [Pedosphaera sp.]
MKIVSKLNPFNWFKSRRSESTELIPLWRLGDRSNAGVPLGAVKTLPSQLVSRLFSSENQRRPGHAFAQSELPLPEVRPIRSNLLEDDVELIRRRKSSRLIHETRPTSSTPGYHDPELALNRLRKQHFFESQPVHQD